MATENAKNIAEAYRKRRNEVSALLSLVAQEADAHAESAEQEGLHWGHVGDLGRAKELLAQALAFLSQQDEAFVEQALEDIAAKGRRDEGADPAADPDGGFGGAMSAIAKIRNPAEMVDALAAALRRGRFRGAPAEAGDALAAALARERGWGAGHPTAAALRRCAEALARQAQETQENP